jgi:hypothetical protein
MELPSNVMKSLKGEKPTYEEIQRDVMRIARENDLTDEQAGILMKRKLRQAGLEVKDMRYGGKACRGRKAAGSAEKAR